MIIKIRYASLIAAMVFLFASLSCMNDCQPRFTMLYACLAAAAGVLFIYRQFVPAKPIQVKIFS